MAVMRAVIFDLDGTLADTSADLVAAANTCFAEMGRDGRLDARRDARTALRGGKAMLRAGGLSEPEVERWYPRLLEAYGAALDTHTRLYPGALEAVEALRTGGYAVGICTNKPQALAEALMVSLGARAAFASLVGADTLPVRKPDPAPFRLAVERAGGDPGRAALVGDSDTDRETARAAGAASILVTFGPAGAEMAGLAPEALLDAYADLPGVVDALRL